MNKPLGYEIHFSTQAESDFIDHSIVKFNKIHAPFTQSQDFIQLNFHIKSEKDTIIAGINALLYCWGMLYIDTLVVDEKYRYHKLGSHLLLKVETEAKSMKASLSHLDTFDWQAKDFYLKAGYEIFGILDDCPLGHKRYYMKRNYNGLAPT